LHTFALANNLYHKKVVVVNKKKKIGVSFTRKYISLSTSRIFSRMHLYREQINQSINQFPEKSITL